MLSIFKKYISICLVLCMFFSYSFTMNVFAEESQVDGQENITEEIEANKNVNESDGFTEEVMEDSQSTDSDNRNGIQEEVTNEESKDELYSEEVGGGAEENAVSEIQQILDGDSSLVNYFYVGSPVLQTPAQQDFILSFGNGTEGFSSLKIHLQNKSGEESTIESSVQQNGSYVFSKSFEESETGEYSVVGFSYCLEKQEYYVSFSDLEMDVRFGVNQEYDGYGESEGYSVDENGVEVNDESNLENQRSLEESLDTSIVSLDSENSSNTETLVEDVIKESLNSGVQSRSLLSNSREYTKQNPLVVCIDPGHGGTDSGTVLVNGGLEKTYNLKIAQYLKAELEQYSNVTVVMTRTGDTNPSLQERAQIAANAKATALVSIHLNATGWGTQSSISGAEVYYPSANYNASVSQTGKNLAQNIINQLSALGIYNRGITIKYVYDEATGKPANDDRYDYPDGSVGDYYGVIRYSKRLGVAGIIVEHCFADNWNDYNKFLSSDSKLKNLGVADATGIAKAFGLQKNNTHLISYKTHVQDYGWLDTVYDKATGGTTGKSKRMEGIQIQLGNTGYSGGIKYRSHVQDVGWQNWVQNGQLSGTSGQSKRIEAIQIQLTGEVATHYDVYYRAHAQNFDWMGWAKNGESAGSAGYGYRMEAIQICLVKKGNSAPGSTSNAFKSVLVKYQPHVQNDGWKSTVSDGALGGTEGQSKRLEALIINLGETGYSGSIEYKAHVEDIGWQGWKKNGQTAGTTNKSKAMEAIQIRLTGDISKYYDVYYRVHSQNFGWLGWAKNGQSAGTSGYRYRMEAIQIKLVKKGLSAPGNSNNCYKVK